MTTMFVQLRRLVYLLVLLQCCMCVTHAEEDAVQKKAEQFLEKWVSEWEEPLVEGKGYKEVWNATVESCITNAKAARKVADRVDNLRKYIVEQRLRRDKGLWSEGAVRDKFVKLVKEAAEEVEKDLNVLQDAGVRVEEARYLVRMGGDAIDKMKVVWENRNNSRKQHTEVLKGVDEEKRSVAQGALIKRSKRVYDDMNQTYHELLVIKRRSIACAKELSNGVIVTKNKIYTAGKLMEEEKGRIPDEKMGYGVAVKKFAEAVKKSLGEELVRVTYFNNKTKADGEMFVVGRTSASAFAGAVKHHETKRTAANKTKLEAEVAAAREKARENMVRKKEEEEQEVRSLHEEKQRERERKKAEEEEKRRKEQERKDAEERRKEQERKKAEEEVKRAKEAARKAKEEQAKQELEKKAKEEMEKKKKKKDGSSSPALMHSPLLLLLVLMCVLGCTLVC
ncbi:uncharacterized protein TM35_001191000 [Trypanosoma theileri]|uniref:Transglutaminase n=1 Tax=Trypanosoma theileri TaxID=67003 RepID=A0A1X0NDN1_9TRYP|nr:uncharacterized protein TM35_001191000 [Trypanosoma theileri]ORC81349.1 hypothetical protein TM35_001191000 [Trypanosoma theileri]